MSYEMNPMFVSNENITITNENKNEELFINGKDNNKSSTSVGDMIEYCTKMQDDLYEKWTEYDGKFEVSYESNNGVGKYWVIIHSKDEKFFGWDIINKFIQDIYNTKTKLGIKEEVMLKYMCGDNEYCYDTYDVNHMFDKVREQSMRDFPDSFDTELHIIEGIIEETNNIFKNYHLSDKVINQMKNYLEKRIEEKNFKYYSGVDIYINDHGKAEVTVKHKNVNYDFGDKLEKEIQKKCEESLKKVKEKEKNKVSTDDPNTIKISGGNVSINYKYDEPSQRSINIGHEDLGSVCNGLCIGNTGNELSWYRPGFFTSTTIKFDNDKDIKEWVKHQFKDLQDAHKAVENSTIVFGPSNKNNKVDNKINKEYGSVHRTKLSPANKSPYTEVEFDADTRCVRLIDKDGNSKLIMNLASGDSFISQVGNLTTILYPYSNIVGEVIMKLKYYCKNMPKLGRLVPYNFWKD